MTKTKKKQLTKQQREKVLYGNELVSDIVDSFFKMAAEKVKHLDGQTQLFIASRAINSIFFRHAQPMVTFAAQHQRVEQADR